MHIKDHSPPPPPGPSDPWPEDPDAQAALLFDALPLLQSAVNQTEGDLSTRASALSAALDKASVLVMRITSADPALLTEQAKEVINLFARGSVLLDQYVKQIADKVIESGTPLVEMITKLPKSDRSESMVKFMTLLLEIQKRAQEELTTLSALSFIGQINQLDAAAKEIEKEAADVKAAELSRGWASVFGGALQAGFGGRAAITNRQTGKLDVKAKQLERQADASIREHNEKLASNFGSEAGKYQEKSIGKRFEWDTHTVFSQVAPNVLNGFGSVGTADEQEKAAEHRANQSEFQKDATVDERRHSTYESLNDLLQRSTATLTNLVGEALKTDADQYQAAARV